MHEARLGREASTLVLGAATIKVDKGLLSGRGPVKWTRAS